MHTNAPAYASTNTNTYMHTHTYIHTYIHHEEHIPAEAAPTCLPGIAARNRSVVDAAAAAVVAVPVN
jgi:hypothetical protein